MNQQPKKSKIIENFPLEDKHFAHLLESYGAEVKRWPQEYQIAARQLLDSSETARQLQQAALALDNLLDTVQIPPPSPWLRQRILASVQRTTTATQDIWQRFLQWIIGTTPLEHLWRPAVTFLLPLVLGIMIGFYSTQSIYGETQTQISSVTVELAQEVSLLGLTSSDFLE